MFLYLVKWTTTGVAAWYRLRNRHTTGVALCNLWTLVKPCTPSNLTRELSKSLLETLKRIQRIEEECGGEISLSFQELPSGEIFSYFPNRKVKTASVIKFPLLAHIALAVEEGDLQWGEVIPLEEAEKTGGAGVLPYLSTGLPLTLRDLCVLMTIISDNTATNVLIERLGVAPCNAKMRALGLRETTLYRKAYALDTPESLQFGLGSTTPQEMLQLLTLVAENRLGSPETCAEILHFLELQQHRYSIPRYLPEHWTYAGKTGAIDAVRNDIGLITTTDGRRFALAVFIQKLPRVQWTVDNPGVLAIAQIAQMLLPS